MPPNPYKFRVWDKHKKQFLKDFVLHDGKVLLLNSKKECHGHGDFFTELSTGTCYGQFYYQEDVIIQQSTGLVDKYGTEIFEGDIVHFVFGNMEAKCLVYRDKYLGLKTDLGGWTSLVHVNTHGKILGNVFQNPDLKFQDTLWPDNKKL